MLTSATSDEPKDEVVEMQPPAGTRSPTGSKVTLFCSDGPEDVPDVVGKTEAEATQADRGRRLQGQRVTDSTTEAKKGTVLQQSPTAGQTLRQGQHGDDRGLDLRAPPSAPPSPSTPPTPSTT